jgi:hypothetical protein
MVTGSDPVFWTVTWVGSPTEVPTGEKATAAGKNCSMFTAGEPKPTSGKDCTLPCASSVICRLA